MKQAFLEKKSNITGQMESMGNRGVENATKRRQSVNRQAAESVGGKIYRLYNMKRVSLRILYEKRKGV